MTNKKLGIHLAPGALKVVELEHQAGKLKVLNYLVNYLPREESAEPHSQVKTLLSGIKLKKIHTKDAHVVIFGADTIYKLLELPEMAAGDVSSALRFKLKAVLPFSFKDIIVDYYKIKRSGDRQSSLYFVAAVPRPNILNVVEAINATGLSVKNVVPPSTALRNILAKEQAQPSAAIYLGKYSSLILLIKEGQVVFAREVTVGGDDITQAMVGAVQTEQGPLELDYKRAEEIKDKFGIPFHLEEYSKESGVPAAELLGLMRPALEKLTGEIWNTFDYYRAEIGDDTEFTKVLISGGGSKTKNLVQYLKQQLGADVALVEPEVSSEVEGFAEDKPALTLAMGAALSGADQLSLMPEEKKGVLSINVTPLFSKIVERFNRRWLVYISFIFVYLLVLTVVFGWFEAQRENLVKSYQSLQQEYSSQKVKLSKVLAEIKGEIPKLDISKYGALYRFPLVMQELDRITPQDVYFKSVKYDNNTSLLLIDGVVVKGKKKIGVANFYQRLSRSQYFETIDLVFLSESDAYSVPTYDFQIKCILVGRSQP
ncbi:MAG: pilus assembly protein PilM [Candidatus Margulisbacteria bacterium]|nr:pilus assembly protein PilM [Candidatus Margulisiibacteriota bacterium]MBU1022270.1 pilus assembly protein PilM [Candidatus Margulisiibacteriota bacterium]MBU1729291.1 pilus assembly protein PilM [Candidatus Margulisiibacteriota bacterium]MBU1955564.1 pilus assembly protein PilM [Candidatus Margulisiibacteriota bacterium]